MIAIALIALFAEAALLEAPGVSAPARAKMNWMLHCQGCHQADASGSANGAPSMVNEVARFLSVDGGRDYLMRVPGVANAGLSDDQLAELLNWTLATFDREHLPSEFKPFSGGELAALRKDPLVAEASATRERLRSAFLTGSGVGEGGGH